MNEYLGIMLYRGVLVLLDGPTDFTWPAIAAGTLVVVIGGVAVGLLQRRWGKTDEAEKAEKAAIQKRFDEFGLSIATEREERARDIETETRNRMGAIAEESNVRREKDEALGSEIAAIRERMAYEAGAAGKERPQFRRRKT